MVKYYITLSEECSDSFLWRMTCKKMKQ